jgi:RecB family endonuclease NucS
MLFKSFFKTTHDQLMGAVAETLREGAWDVQLEPIVGTVRPDLVARGPSGQTYVIEVKQADTAAWLGAVAQVEAYRNALAEECGDDAKGLLVMVGDTPEALGDVAARAGVVLVRPASTRVGAVHEAFVHAGILGSAISARNGGVRAA